MKIYTRQGDRGQTALFGGKRVSKSACRIEAYGTVDELNSFLGLARSNDITSTGEQLLEEIQNQLFILGADLATPLDTKERIERLDQEQVEWLEEKIDELQKDLPDLTHFILPGGAPAGAHLHVARTVCRRAERICVRCKSSDSISDNSIKYLNRLSDFLFVLARFENHQADVEERAWKVR